MATKVLALDGNKVIATQSIDATAQKVSNPLKIGDKLFDGSTEVAITAEDLGALEAVPVASTSETGVLKLGFNSQATITQCIRTLMGMLMSRLMESEMFTMLKKTGV